MSLKRGVIGSLPWDCGQYTPERAKKVVGTDEDGQPIFESYSWMPSLTLLDAAGNVRRISLTNGASDRRTDAPQGRVRVARIMQKGGMPYYECPMHYQERLKYLPDSLRDEPCSAGEFGPKIGPCRHVQKLEEVRKKAQAKKAAREAEKVKSWSQRLYEQDKEKRDMTMEAVAKLADKVEKIAAPKEPIKEERGARKG